MTEQTPPNPSPLYLLSNTRFGGRTYSQEKVLNVAATRVTLVENNPNRVFLAVINEGAIDVRLSSDTNISSTSGWLLAQLGGVIVFNWEDDGESVGYAVYAIATAAGANVRVREVIRL